MLRIEPWFLGHLVHSLLLYWLTHPRELISYVYDCQLVRDNSACPVIVTDLFRWDWRYLSCNVNAITHSYEVRFSGVWIFIRNNRFMRYGVNNIGIFVAVYWQHCHCVITFFRKCVLRDVWQLWVILCCNCQIITWVGGSFTITCMSCDIHVTFSRFSFLISCDGSRVYIFCYIQTGYQLASWTTN